MNFFSKIINRLFVARALREQIGQLMARISDLERKYSLIKAENVDFLRWLGLNMQGEPLVSRNIKYKMEIGFWENEIYTLWSNF